MNDSNTAITKDEELVVRGSLAKEELKNHIIHRLSKNIVKLQNHKQKNNELNNSNSRVWLVLVEPLTQD